MQEGKILTRNTYFSSFPVGKHHRRKPSEVSFLRHRASCQSSLLIRFGGDWSVSLCILV